jgi:hypothetical protein
MATPKQREKFIVDFWKHANNAPASVYEQRKIGETILRAAATYQRVEIARCNREVNKEEEKRQTRIEERLAAILGPYGVVPTFDGDPRGIVVRLKMPDNYNDSFGGEGLLCVPKGKIFDC